ncbi:futalosine synthase [Granulicella rosea]|uniref:Futalosine synthase n=2 Tax=Granulicella rosea TaxID=474952 RepID=A0A239MC50_9BACT|nr:futalosine synthase [Granulicella rosea]
MYDFEHTDRLAERYTLNYTLPSQCAADLLAGRADLGLIPIAALTPELAVVPGCVIASLDRVRSIQLVIKQPYTLETVRTVAADNASRSSLAYSQILFRTFSANSPVYVSSPADPKAMLAQADAALLIGDPALLALEARAEIEAAVGPCTWLDIAHEWHTRLNLPWVAAVWAVRPESLTNVTAAQLIEDLHSSRTNGLAHIERIVETWTPRIAIAPATIREYLTHNLHYTLDEPCIAAIGAFRRLAAEAQALPPLPELRFL